MRIDELQTPALIVEQSVVRANLDAMSAALPGDRLRPHVKAHKCTSLARLQADNGHRGFTCATIREVETMAAAGLGEDLLLANEVLDTRRLGRLVDAGHRVTVAVDSTETVQAAVDGGVREVIVDVNVGMPRCGIAPEKAGALADVARRAGLTVRGVMGYEGHLMLVGDEAERREHAERAMALLLSASADVGGDLISGGGTGTYAVNTWVDEIQAGSYALMDTAYQQVGLPFGQALFVLGRVISASSDWCVADVGIKALSLDHGNPAIDDAAVWFCSDEHITFAPEHRLAVGDHVRVIPAHIDPTVALHERMYLVDGDDVVDEWPVDMRGW
ncbi:metal-activated pyridoxal enzyme [Gordonia sp. TBRC 11910]|uniref:Metal-activated pyridoxal enzyme n=1 Tax=Gordonia asplenii TaxID=2725283 RepID=A0A848L5L5_9ACTN|nr:alanine racemase [Gordonia asplenii]NMO02908.1 metal-activated pyridoxal enzyme [Gordonia asplenii]